jgi:hypothetical protein
MAFLKLWRNCRRRKERMSTLKVPLTPRDHILGPGNAPVMLVDTAITNVRIALRRIRLSNLY